MLQDDQESDLFKTAKRMVKTKQDIICDLCMKNVDWLLAVSEEDKMFG